MEHDRAECEAKHYTLTEVNDLGWWKDQLAIIVLRNLDVTFVAAASPNTLYVLLYTTVKIFQSYMNLFLAIFFTISVKELMRSTPISLVSLFAIKRRNYRCC